jgi:hypothetical protein
MLRVGFEPTTLLFEQAKTFHALDRMIQFYLLLIWIIYFFSLCLFPIFTFHVHVLVVFLGTTVFSFKEYTE